MPRTKRVARRGLGGGFGERRARSPPRPPPPPPPPPRFTPRAEEGEGEGDVNRNKGKEVVVEVKGKSEQFVPQKLNQVARRKAFQLLGYKQTYLRPKREPRSVVGGSNRPSNLFARYEGFTWESVENLNVHTLGVKEPILALGAEFPVDSYAIQAKVKMVSEYFSFFRRAHQDGNCFYRCFIFAYLEQVFEAQDEDEVNHILTCLQQYRQDYVRLGGKDNYFTDLAEVLVDVVTDIPDGKEVNMIYTAEDLYEKCGDEDEMNYTLSLLRLVASVEICKNKESYSLFLDELKYRTPREFCEKEVVPMGVEAAQVQVIALANAFRVPVRILSINSATSPRGTMKLSLRTHSPRPIYNSGQGSSSSGRNRRAYAVTLVYRPGHYDILYPKRRIRS